MGILVTKALVRTELAEMKAASEGKSLEDVAAQAEKELKILENATLNIAITGVSGTGKSALVNALLGLDADDEGAAKTGETETTMKVEAFTHPTLPNVKIWDLPGIGTPTFKAEKYLKDVNFSQYDFFIIVASMRFTEHDASLAREIQKKGKKFYFVRSQIDVSLKAEKTRRGFNEQAMLEKIKNYCCEHLEKAGMSSPKVFLISSKHLEKYDFPLLQDALENDLDDVKKQVLIMAMPAYSKEVLEKKKSAMESLIWKLALTSSVIAAIPIPGTSIACDTAILVGGMKRFRSVFGLDERSLRKLAERFAMPVSELKAVIKHIPQVKDIKKEFVIDHLARSLLSVASTLLELALDFIPVLGSITGAGLSFITTYYQLKSFLSDVLKDVENVRAKVAELDR